jgi:hypothetical protein
MPLFVSRGDRGGTDRARVVMASVPAEFAFLTYG